jgi:hypothetical protein
MAGLVELKKMLFFYIFVLSNLSTTSGANFKSLTLLKNIRLDQEGTMYKHSSLLCYCISDEDTRGLWPVL